MAIHLEESGLPTEPAGDSVNWLYSPSVEYV